MAYSHNSISSEIPSDRFTREKTRLSSSQLVLLLVFATETVLFGTLLSSYLFVRSAMISPYQHTTAARLLFPALNTVVLCLSAFAVQLSVRAVRSGRTTALRFWLWLAIGLGILFVGGQIYEFSRSGMSPTDPALGGMYFALISFHAVHVLAGMVVLGLVIFRAYLGDFSARSYRPVVSGYWFWGYVTIIWLTLFVALYLV